MKRYVIAVFKIVSTTLLSLKLSNKSNINKLSRVRNRKIVLFVVSPADINAPGIKGKYPDKVFSLYEYAQELGFDCAIVFHPLVANKYISNIVPILRIENLLRSLLLMLRIEFFVEDKFKSDHFQSWWNSIGKLEKFYFSIWSSFLQRVKPNLVIGIDTKESLVVACKVRNVQIMEIMHGTFTKETAPLRRLIRGSENILPVDFFLSWDIHYSKIMEGMGIPAIEIGYPNKDFAKSTSRVIEPAGKSILVTLSWGVVDSEDPFGMLHKELFTRLDSLASSNLNFRFRIHPVANERFKANMGGVQDWFKNRFPKSKLSLPSEISLYEDLLSANLHISQESSTFYEAGLLGVPTLFVSQEMYQATPFEHRNKGGVFLWENDFDIHRIISANFVVPALGKKLDYERFSRILISRI